MAATPPCLQRRPFRPTPKIYREMPFLVTLVVKKDSLLSKSLEPCDRVVVLLVFFSFHFRELFLLRGSNIFNLVLKPSQKRFTKQDRRADAGAEAFLSDVPV